MTRETLYPISVFSAVNTPKPEGSVECEYHSFVAFLESYAEEPFASKESAPLFAVTHFKREHRKKANATTSGLVILDIDHGLRLDDVITIVQDLKIACVIYTTASHRANQHKFRICVPLEHVVDYELHRASWYAVSSVLTDAAADPSKVGCESLFYVPGRYSGSPSEFHVFDGVVLSAEEWIDLAGPGGQPKAPKSAHRKSWEMSSRSVVRTRSSAGRAPNEFDLNLYETKLVTDAALEKYLSAYGDWHHARFGLMSSIAGRAVAMGIQIAADDIVALFNQIDEIDGGHYQTEKYQIEIRNDATKVLAQIV